MDKLPYWRLSLFYFFYFAVLGGYMPYWPLYLDRLSFSPADIGRLTAIGMLTRILAPGFWGWLADTTGKRIELVRFGAAMICLFWAGILWIGHNFLLMAAVLFCYSFFQNAILAQFEAVTIAHLGDERSRYGRIRLWGSIGFIATVSGLGFLFDYVRLTVLPGILLVCALISAGLARLVPAPPAGPARVRRESIVNVLRQRPVLVFLLVHFLLQLSHAPYYGFFSLYMEQHGYSRTAIGLLWSLGVLAEVLAFTQTHRILSRWSESALVSACLLLAGLRWFVIAWGAASPVLIVTVQILHAFSFAVFHAVAMQWVFREFSAGQQGQGQALYSALWGLGVAVGAWLAGAWWSPGTGPWIYSASTVICLGALMLWGIGQGRPSTPGATA